MTEYGFEIKLKVVQDYLDGKGGYRYLAKKYGVKNADQVRSWINSYQQFGEEGLFRKHYDNTYSVQFKMDAIELYQTSELSYREVANRLGMRNHALIASWMRSFRDEVSRDSQNRKDVHLPCLRKKKSQRKILLK